VLRQTPKKVVDKYLDAGKSAMEDIHNPTPMAIAGNQASDALKTINTKMNAF
jgi:hypothetical protein